ncbi:putative MFS-type transporter [Trichinella spiralis]|uniref:MFS-type transporter n=1 Tax=Trichinella spiralis TaxID=6334 RepID=A0ABR3L2J6_TRISP
MVSVHGIPVTENSNIPFNKRLITALAECKEEVHTGFAGQLCRKLPSSNDAIPMKDAHDASDTLRFGAPRVNYPLPSVGISKGDGDEEQ